MSLVFEQEMPLLNKESSGAIRVGQSRVLLELVVHAFQDGASPEAILQSYPTLSLSEVYGAIAYYLRHPDAVESYLQERESMAASVRQKINSTQPDLRWIRERMLAC
ncbi:MAG: DUF433 domain-containing protein [Thermostichus sp. HHBFW_bins_43]